jgi:hypothetical protein
MFSYAFSYAYCATTEDGCTASSLPQLVHPGRKDRAKNSTYGPSERFSIMS